MEGTLSAMLSSFLWTEEGMLTCERGKENTNNTIWDRSTLYGMKCAFLNGLGDRMMSHLLAYCHKRLVCDHVPYAVEAYPEGDKRHLSGESALFVRVITEGVFGILPEGLDLFSFVPRLPKEFDRMSLTGIHIAGGCFDFFVERDVWTISEKGLTVATGNTDGQRVVVQRKS
jgi:hypothetical protein